jgi:hypothetical protein
MLANCLPKSLASMAACSRALRNCSLRASTSTSLELPPEPCQHTVDSYASTLAIKSCGSCVMFDLLLALSGSFMRSSSLQVVLLQSFSSASVLRSSWLPLPCCKFVLVLPCASPILYEFCVDSLRISSLSLQLLLLSLYLEKCLPICVNI